MHGLADDLNAYLVGLESDQGELAKVCALKGRALRRSDAPALLALSEAETRLVDQLRRRLGEREQLLGRARAAGIVAGTLAEVADGLGDDGAHLHDRIERSRRTAERLRRETWVHWIVARRSVGQYAELLETIEHHGQRAATYATPADDDNTGGAVFDASA